jgi:hypothetical protein
MEVYHKRVYRFHRRFYMFSAVRKFEANFDVEELYITGNYLKFSH